MFETEEEFVQSFIRHAPPSLWSRNNWRIQLQRFESTCSDGRADWVWAAMQTDWRTDVLDETASLIQIPACSRILSQLNASSPRTEEFLRSRSGVSARCFRRYLSMLSERGLIVDTGERRFVLGDAITFPEMEICAFEFKLGNWQRAFFQATRYRSFSHRVYVVMPLNTVHRVNEFHDAFRRQNVGLLSHAPDGTSKKILPSAKRSPRMRSHFIKAVGMLHESEAYFSPVCD